MLTWQEFKELWKCFRCSHELNKRRLLLKTNQTLADVGPKREPMSTPSIHLCVPSKTKCESLVATGKFLKLKSCLSFNNFRFFKSSFIQILMFSSKDMLLNKESTSEIPIKKSGCWSKIFSAKWKVSFTVNSLVVKGFKIGPKILQICRQKFSKPINFVEMTSNRLRFLYLCILHKR